MAAKVICEFLRKVPNQNIRSDLNGLPKTLSFSLNTGFWLGCIDLCEEATSRFSQSYYKTVFLESFLILGKDKCPNVLMNFCWVAPKVAAKIAYKDTKNYERLVNILKDMSSVPPVMDAA